MEYKFINRYGNEILFIKEGDTFEMKGGYYYRYLFNVDDEGKFLNYDAVDPSGGPFMQTGDNLKHYFNTEQDMFINDLNHTGKQVTFFIDEVNKTNYKDPLDQG